MKFSDPVQIVTSIGINDASIVVDLGCGSGHYALACARAVGTEGRIYAVDVQKDLLEKLSSQAQSQQLFNIETLWADIEKPETLLLRENIADVVLLCNVLFQVENKSDLLSQAVRLARPRGRLVVVDWSDSHNGMGPAEELIVTQQKTKELIEQNNNLSLEREIDAGDHHYGMVLRVNKKQAVGEPVLENNSHGTGT